MLKKNSKKVIAKTFLIAVHAKKKNSKKLIAKTLLISVQFLRMQRKFERVLAISKNSDRYYHCLTQKYFN